MMPNVRRRTVRTIFLAAGMPRLWRFRLLVIFLILAPTFLAACEKEDESWERIERAGVLRVGLDPTFPPFEEMVDSEVSGLDVDLARALGNELGLEVEFVFFGYDGLYDALATKQVDVLISALVIVPGRMRDFAYSAPYFNAGEILVTTNDSTMEDMTSLAGKKLAVELGAQGHVEATKWAKRLPDLSILPYTSAAEALDAVVAGEADAALVDGVSGRLYLKDKEISNLQRKSEPATVEPYAVVVRIEDETLLDKLDDALLTLTADGELDMLIERWLGM
jgi:ABC-type amino acid transport substrate-binding protein